jgi:hypothetical protein
VGIGTSSPGGALDVVRSGELQVNFNSTASGSEFVQKANGGQVARHVFVASGQTAYSSSFEILQEFGGQGVLNNRANQAIKFLTNDNERMRIDSSGNLLVGTTSSIARLQVNRASTDDLPTLQISGPASANYRTFSVLSNRSGDLSQAAALFSKFDNNTTTSQVFVHFVINNNTATSGQINANGANSAAFGTYSDIRLKENVVDLPPQLGNVCGLRPVEFDYKDGSGHQIGFIAQEVQQIYPDVVGEGKDGMLTLTGMSKMESRIIKAIQEQQAIITALTARVAALESN